MEALPIFNSIPKLEDKQRAWDMIRKRFPELILDPDHHQVVWDEQGVLRFEADPLIKALANCGALSLNEVAKAVARGQMTEEQQRKVAKKAGYSVYGFFELSFVKQWLYDVNGYKSKK